MVQLIESSPWAPPTSEPKPLTAEGAYSDALKPDSDVDDMRMLVGPAVKPVSAGDIVFVKRSESSGGGIEQWRLTDRISESGKRIAESLEPTLVNGVEAPAERPIADEDLTPEGQYSLSVQHEQQQEEADRQARIAEAHEVVTKLTFVPKKPLPTNPGPNFVALNPPVSVDEMPPLPPDTVDENAMKRNITVIHGAQSLNPPKKKWYERKN